MQSPNGHDQAENMEKLVQIGYLEAGIPAMSLPEEKMKAAVKTLFKNLDFNEVKDIHINSIRIKKSGGFFYLFGEAVADEAQQIREFALSLSQQKNALLLSENSCLQECLMRSAHSCPSNCGIVIHEKCRSLSCDCPGGEGGCDTSVTTGIKISQEFLAYFES